MKPTVFIHTNHKQYLGALVGAYAFKRMSARPDSFDVSIIHADDHAFLREREGQTFARGGKRTVWRMDDLQSFTPLRFMPPELMGYEGRAVIVDPDVFAVGDIATLLERDMRGHAIHCRKRPGRDGRPGGNATSVMLLDCARLRHWQVETQFAGLFEGGLDYADWIELEGEDPASIAPLEPVWNDFDHLTPETRLLHTTKRHTQPWKTGLPVDFTEANKFRLFPPKGWIRAARRRLLGDHARRARYQPHPDPAQEQLFFGLLKEALAKGGVERELVAREMRADHLRHDALAVLDRTPALEQQQAGRLAVAA